MSPITSKFNEKLWAKREYLQKINVDKIKVYLLLLIYNALTCIIYF